MRIVGGRHRSRLIDFPSDASITRPTKDVVREGIFNALSSEPMEAVVLDLFAGSGSFGLEAISRGAKMAIFVDTSNTAIQTINKNLKALKESDKALVWHLDYLDALKLLKERDLKVKIVFLDPPYKNKIIDEIIDKILLNDILTNDGIIISETDYKIDTDMRFTYVKSYKYGKTYITIRRRTL